MPAMIEFDHVKKNFRGKTVIPDLTLTIPEKQIFVLVGRSGSGKTTTLKMINALIKPDAGTIKYNGKALTDYKLQDLRWQIGYVLQQIGLFPNMTVAQNLALIPEMQHHDAAKILRRSRELLAAGGLDPDTYMARAVTELSGGEAQRVGILRALAADPPTILMDEPFSALDPLSRRQLQDLVLELQAKLHKTIIFVTHDMNEALKMGDQIAVMDGGRILQIGAPDAIRNNPAHAVVASMFAGTKDDDGLAQPVSAVIQAGFAMNAVQLNQRQVSADAPLSTIITELREHGGVQVTVADQTYTITAGDVLAFLDSLG